MMVGLFGALILGTTDVRAQDDEETDEPITRILFLFDASNSMNGQWESGAKITIAQQLLDESVEALKINPDVELGLRVYGHQTPKRVGEQDCNDTRLEVPFGTNNHDDIIQTIYEIYPKGTTPIARSLEQAAGDFPECDNCRNVIILITDGIEACDGDPCAISKALQDKGIILKPFVIGIGVEDQFKYDFQCIGNFFDASNEENFKQIMQIVIQQALNTTSVQVNLNDDHGDPTETNVPMTFYDSNTGEQLYNYVHTLNYKGNPDTLTIDPIPTYRLVVHTIPPVTVDDITIVPGKHNTIEVDAGQGTLDLAMEDGRGNFYEIDCVIRAKDAERITNVQLFNETEDYLNGTYIVEALTLPRTYFEVEIKQSETTKIEIPQPGTASIILPSMGHVGIFKHEGDELVWVCNMSELTTSEKYYLQPGDYTIIFRSKKTNETLYTITKEFTIESGSTNTIRLL